MIITTTPTVEGRRITEYKGIVFGEVIAGVNVVKDIAASFSNFFGGRSGTYESELINAREQALYELEQRALQLNADAVVAVDVDYEVLGSQRHADGHRQRHRRQTGLISSDRTAMEERRHSCPCAGRK